MPQELLKPLKLRAPPQAAPTTITNRLTRLTLIAAGAALLVAGAILNGAMFLIERSTLVDQMCTQTQLIAANAAAPMLVADQRSAAGTLMTLAADENVARATLFDSADQPVADYRRPGEPDLPVSAGTPGAGITGNRLVIVDAVRASGRAVGWIRVAVVLDPLYRRALLQVAVTLGATVCALLLAWLIAVGVRRDVQRMEQQLDNLAYRDPVTGLYNRRAAETHLRQFMAITQQLRARFAVITLDLDGFKSINDTFGHTVGDGVLRLAAERICHSLPEGSRAYRLGGDEFVVLSTHPDVLQEPLRAAHLLRRAICGGAFIEGYEVNLGASVGVARYPQDGADEQEVMRASDIAMYVAKAQGRNGVAVYDARLRAASEERLHKEVALRHALANGELRLYYQPVIDLRSGRLVGAEALVRWLDPARGLMPPADFIAVAESSGLVVELGGWALGEAAQQLVRWANLGLGHLGIAVNVSARQLAGAILVGQYRDAVALAGCDPRRLEIELTEHTLVEDVEENLRTLGELRDLGVGIAIDDFGTGLSSLAYLKRLPITKLKIDRSFVRDLPSDRSDTAIISAAVSMARALGLRVVAEGVETEQQRAAVCALGCDLAQGYLYARPLPVEEFELWAASLDQPLALPAPVVELRRGA